MAEPERSEGGPAAPGPGPESAADAAPPTAFAPGVPAQPGPDRADRAGRADGAGGAHRLRGPWTGPDGAWYGPDAFAPEGYDVVGDTEPRERTGTGAAPTPASRAAPHPGARPYAVPWAAGAYAPDRRPLAALRARARAAVVDAVLAWGPLVLAHVATLAAVALTGPEPAATATRALVLALGAAWGVGWSVADGGVRQGRRGRSAGKQVAGLRLLDERTALPPGAGRAMVRQGAHLVDVVLLGWLWALRDDRRRTVADRLCGTVVVEG